MTPLFFRFMFRSLTKHGNRRQTAWNVLPSPPSRHGSLEDAQALALRWTKQDAGKREWTCAEVLPGDYDYPQSGEAQA